MDIRLMRKKVNEAANFLAVDLAETWKQGDDKERERKLHSLINGLVFVSQELWLEANKAEPEATLDG